MKPQPSTTAKKEEAMDARTMMIVCFVTAAVCGLVMYYSRKKNAKMIDKAIVTEDAEAFAKACSHGKIPFVIALVIGAIAAGTFLVLALALAFGGGVKLFTG